MFMEQESGVDGGDSEAELVISSPHFLKAPMTAN